MHAVEVVHLIINERAHKLTLESVQVVNWINERADKLILESEVKRVYDHAVEVVNWIINARACRQINNGLWSKGAVCPCC